MTELERIKMRIIDECKNYEPSTAIVLAPLSCANQAKSSLNWYSEKKKKEEIPMNNYASATLATVDNSDKAQRNYLGRRVDSVYYEKKDTFRNLFSMDAYQPKSPQELADMIKNGEFEIKGLGDEDQNKSRWFYWTDALTFRKAPADKAGYEKAKEDLKKALQDAQDIIAVKSLDEGFSALKALEAWEPTTAAS